ncbi:MAG: NAD-dependent deacylase [Deltaproteobacteria bacterium]|nr:NAD-dependent deacylase [Deltaproteobacteria bacterium]
MLAGYQRIVLLTGAGLSHSAGLPTYRGPDGLWNDPKLARMNDVEALSHHREDVCSMFWKFRSAIGKALPTVAHRALAAFERALKPPATMTIITQNVDGLHQRAGSVNVCEYHGTLTRWRCEVCQVELEPPWPAAPPGESNDVDPSPPDHCGEVMRPSVVLFGEMIPTAAERTAKYALRDCDLFVAIGTSDTVAPASSFVRWAQLNNARRVLLNLEIFDEAHDQFTDCVAGPADELVPRWFATEC